jgi:hypothetical protein
VEGEPGGRVRFRCVVPIDGQPAVAQQFEAEGPTLEEAAAATLLRIVLWRATEVAAETPVP